MASYDSALGMWKARNGQYYGSQSEALDAERNYIDDSEFMGTSGIEARAPDAVAPPPDPRDAPNPANPGGISDNELQRRTTALQTGATRTANINYQSDRNAGFSAPQTGVAGGATGAYNAGSAAGRAAFDYMHELGSPGYLPSGRQVVNRLGERAGISHAGDVADPGLASYLDVAWTPEQLVGSAYQHSSDPSRGLGTTMTGSSGGAPLTRSVRMGSEGAGGSNASASGWDTMGGTAPPDFDRGAGRDGIDQQTQDAAGRANEVIADNRDENAQLFADAFAQYDNLA